MIRLAPAGLLVISRRLCDGWQGRQAGRDPFGTRDALAGPGTVAAMGTGAQRETLSPLSLVAIAAGAFIFAHDFVGVGIAVPAIQDHFSASLGSVQWAITGFSIAIAMSVVPAGRLADAYGAGRTFVIGALGFAFASALVAIAPALWVVLAARALEGMAGGFLWISTIALVFTYFGPRRAGLAGALLIGIAGIGTALGPVDAGLLIEWLGWRAVFALQHPR